MLERAVLAVALAFMAVPACAQQQSKQDCEPGFERREYPHGSELNYRCRTRVIDCPDKAGHYWAVIAEPTFNTARGVQFGYRCEYFSKER